MPWTMSDYPPSWKNLAQLERKKRLTLEMQCSRMVMMSMM